MRAELLFAALAGSESVASGGTPDGEVATLAAIRKKSTSKKPKGSVLLNPGGPGTSGIQAVLAIQPGSQPLKLLEDFDLVGVDPRGVGQSTPIKCNPVIWNKRVPTLVDNQAQFDATLRQAVRDSKFNFVGLPYGSQIGYRYAEMFPSKVGRMALDGIVDHTKPPVYAVQAEANTLETTLHKFIDWCGNNKTCALHNNTDIADFIKGLAAKAEASFIPALKCQQSGQSPCQPNVNRVDLLAGIQAGLILEAGIPPYQPGWSELAEYLLAASKGDASGLSAHYYLEGTDMTGDSASLAVGCQDWEHSKGFADLKAIEDMAKVFAPITLGITQSLSYVTRCVAWSTSLKNPQQP